MKKLIVFLLAFCLLLGGCSGLFGGSSQSQSAEPEILEYPVSVGDVTLQERPMRVISLSPAITDLLVQLGYGDQLVGVSDDCAPENRPRLGTSLNPDFSGIEGLAPDLMISMTALPERTLLQFQQAGAEVLVLTRPQSFAELLQFYRSLCLLLEGQTSGGKRADQLDREIDEWRQRVQSAVERELAAGAKKPSAILLYLPEEVMATGDTLEQELLELIGVENAAANGVNWRFVPEEGFAPDLIFLNSGVERAQLEQSELYSSLEAVQSQKVYSVDWTVLECLSLYLFETLERMAEQAYPQADFDPVESSAGSESVGHG